MNTVKYPLNLEEMGIDVPEVLDVPAVNIISNEIRKKYGIEVIPLHMGVPGIPAPEVIKQTQIEAIREGLDERYCLEGNEKLIAELTVYYRQRIGVEVDREHIVIVNGGMEAGSFCFDVLGHRDQRRKVIFVTPGFRQSYDRIVSCGLEPIIVSMEDGQGGFMQTIEEQVSTQRASLIVLSNPNNPTGRVLADEELKQLAQICNNDDYDVVCAVDDAYLELNYRKRTYRHLMQLTPRAVSLWSASKIYSQAGNRVGAIVGCRELMRQEYPGLKDRFATPGIGGALKRLQHNSNVNPNSPAQAGVAAGLAYDNSHRYELSQGVRKIYQHRIERLKALCLKDGFELLYEPGGAIYLAVDHPRTEDGNDLARKLLSVGVASVPLFVFLGSQRGVRLSVSKLDEAAGRRLGESLAAFNSIS
jgi:aspartate/methionine/tyrosine aminotransferase